MTDIQDVEPVEIYPFSLTFDGDGGYVDFRPQVRVVDPKEETVSAAVTYADQKLKVEKESPPEPIQDQLPLEPEPESEMSKILKEVLEEKPEEPLKRHNPKSIIQSVHL